MEEEESQKRRGDRLDGGELGGSGGLHSLHAGCVEHIGEASREEAAQKGERGAGGACRPRRTEQRNQA